MHAALHHNAFGCLHAGLHFCEGSACPHLQLPWLHVEQLSPALEPATERPGSDVAVTLGCLCLSVCHRPITTVNTTCTLQVNCNSRHWWVSLCIGCCYNLNFACMQQQNIRHKAFGQQASSASLQMPIQEYQAYEQAKKRCTANPLDLQCKALPAENKTNWLAMELFLSCSRACHTQNCKRT